MSRLGELVHRPEGSYEPRIEPLSHGPIAAGLKSTPTALILAREPHDVGKEEQRFTGLVLSIDIPTVRSPPAQRAQRPQDTSGQALDPNLDPSGGEPVDGDGQCAHRLTSRRWRLTVQGPGEDDALRRHRRELLGQGRQTTQTPYL